MIVFAPPLVTHRRPVADATMFDWFRISFRWRLLRRYKVMFNFSEESEVAVDQELLWFCAAAKNDMHVFGNDSLNCRQQVGIETELNYRSRLGRARELCFHDFVGEWPEIARPIE